MEYSQNDLNKMAMGFLYRFATKVMEEDAHVKGNDKAESLLHYLTNSNSVYCMDDDPKYSSSRSLANKMLADPSVTNNTYSLDRGIVDLEYKYAYVAKELLYRVCSIGLNFGLVKKEDVASLLSRTRYINEDSEAERYDDAKKFVDEYVTKLYRCLDFSQKNDTGKKDADKQ